MKKAWKQDRPTKYEKLLNLDMPFDEAVERLSKVDAKKVKTNIHRKKLGLGRK